MIPRSIQSTFHDGLTLLAKGRAADAAPKFARVRAVAPDAHEGWYHGGLAALLLGRAAEGVALLKRAKELEPHMVPIALSLGIAHVANGEPAAAELVLRSVAEREPKSPDVWRYLGMVYENQQRLEYARMARQNLLTLMPKSPGAWIEYGSTLSLMDRQAEALQCFARALSLDQHNLRARVGRAMIYLRSHRPAEAVAELQESLRRDPKDLLARSFYLTALNYLPSLTTDQLFAEHQAFGRDVGAPVNVRWPNPPDPDRRLRIGFLSRDLCEHSVAYFLEPLLAHLDPRQFEIVLYYDNQQIDALTNRMRAHATLWRQIMGQIDATVEATVRTDAVDVLVELAGHTASNRLPLLARRLAPVQVSYLGYPNTTGVPAIDYRFVDEVTDPAPEADRLATEQLVRFAPTAWAYQPPPNAPEVAPLPVAAGAPFTFGSFSNFAKVTDETLRAWTQILNQVPGSRLLIKASGLDEAHVSGPLRNRLRAAGLPEDRVELLPRTRDTLSHLRLYARVDVALDTFPYNGTTTTCEAMWMGVPVITLAGDRHAARVGQSLLAAVGHSEWIARSVEEYVQQAVAVASNQAQLASLRSGLRGELARSDLLDHAGQAARFGAALRDCWRAWCGEALPKRGAEAALVAAATTP